MCHVAGLSFGALGPAYLAHVRGVLSRDPGVAIVAHVRSNYIKHAVSHLRTTCDGEFNHLTSAEKERLAQKSKQQSQKDPQQRLLRRLTVPPGVLLMRAINEAREQARILRAASELTAGRSVQHVIVYEALQKDLPGEMRRLLHAIGVGHEVALRAAATLRPAVSSGSVTPGITDGSSRSSDDGDALVKAGTESLRDALSNYEEIAAFLEPVPCLRSMLAAKAAVVFEPRACMDEIEAMPAILQAAMHEARDGRKFKLNASECGLTSRDQASSGGLVPPALHGGVHRLQDRRAAAADPN